MSLLFSDIEGSTALLSRLGKGYADALDGQRRVLREAWGAHGGTEVGTEGDSFFVVFATAPDAVEAAVRAQRELASFAWPQAGRVRVRIGIHTGSPTVYDGGYVGMAVHRAARISAAAHGGQVVVSSTTAELVSESLPQGVRLRDLGVHQLRDLAQPQHLFQLQVDDLQDDFAALKSLGAASSLPVPATTLVGRDAELAELVELVGSPRVQLVTLTGPGGSGKTRLAIELAQRLTASFPDGVFFVPLAAVTSGDVMWTTIAETIGAHEDTLEPRSFLASVKHRRLLLVLDNLEQLVDATEVVRDLVAGAPQLAVVATSRRPLHLHGEHERPVPPLDVPAHTSLELSEGSGAVRLFCRCARLVRPGFGLTADNATDVTAICRRLDGMPLAIELAAAGTKLLSPAALLARLDRTTDLSARDVDRPTRQQTLRNAIAWSYDLLQPELQAFFRQLGVFAGGCDLDAIGAVVDGVADPLDLVAELVDVSLLAITEGRDGEPRVELLRTVADFAFERLMEKGELDEVRQRHAEHYTALAESTASQLTGRKLTAQDRLVSELDNIEEALGWALQPGEAAPSADRVRLGLRIGGALWRFWLHNGYHSTGRRWLERAVEVGSDEYGKDMATALVGLGAMLYRIDRGRGHRLLQRSLAISRNLGDDSGAATALIGLALSHEAGGDISLARMEFEESVTLCRQSGDDKRLADALNWLADLERRYGSAKRALELTEISRDLARQSGDERLALLCEVDIAWSLALAGRGREALRQLNRIAEDVLSRGELRASAGLVWTYSAVCAVVGDAEDAATLQGAYEAAVDVEPGMGQDPDDIELAERCYAQARPLISPEAWERAYQRGRSYTAEQALAEVRRAAVRYVRVIGEGSEMMSDDQAAIERI